MNSTKNFLTSLRTIHPALRLTMLSALAVAGAVSAAACGAQNDRTHGGSCDDGCGGDDSTTTSSTNSGMGGDIFNPSGGNGGGMQAALLIKPANPTLDVDFGTPGQTVQFKAYDTASNEVKPAWSLNTPEAGTISADGLFTSNGLAGGDITVAAALNMNTATTTLTIHMKIKENPGGISPSDQNTLAGAGNPDPFTTPYPYNKTIFPRGIVPPEVHIQDPTGAQAYYLKVSMPGCQYEGYFSALPQIAASQEAWDALGSCSTGGDATVEISKLLNGQKYGPITESWRIAKGKLHGVIYYNTYDSQLAGATGAMMRIKGNSKSPEVLVGNCTVCHSVSSDGSTAAAANHNGPGGVFDLSGGNVNPPLVWQDAERASFAALFPKNGEVLVINGAPGGFWPPNTPGTQGTWLSELRSKTGMLIPGSGIESYYAQSPVFSHDGTMLAFTDRPAGGGPSVLALMNYDPVAQKFSNYKVLAAPPGGMHNSWPAFTPDNKYVIYQEGVGDDLATWSGNTGHLRMVDVQTGQLDPINTLNGEGYMPQGARDENKNYEPTILPVASGGYFWIMFTSRRTYGNRLLGSQDQTKRLWVSAIDVNAQPGIDPTHPGFYISGQELTSGNSRGFWTLEACHALGQGCESGDQCCDGFCNPDPANPGQFTCGAPDGSCSTEYEPCKTAADCCDKSSVCIGGKCATLPPN